MGRMSSPDLLVPPSFGPIAHLVGRAHANKMSVRFNEEDIIEIRRLYADGATQDDLSLRFGCSVANISNIVLHKTWKGIK